MVMWAVCVVFGIFYFVLALLSDGDEADYQGSMTRASVWTAASIIVAQVNAG